MKTIPSRLYKYQPYNEQTLDNLKNRSLWFSWPVHFNDPFDCVFRPEASELSLEDWQEIYDLPSQKGWAKEAFDAKYSREGSPSETLQRKIIEISEKIFKERVDFMRNTRGVACFSEIRDDMLMWSHYTRGHRGFVLEFDTGYDPFQKAFPVNYSDSLPKVNPLLFLTKRENEEFIKMITTKSSCWSYEKEWRIFHKEGDKEYSIKPDALTGIYFGCEVPYVHIEIIALILRDSPTRLYKMQRSQTEFKVAAQGVNYKPYDYGKST